LVFNKKMADNYLEKRAEELHSARPVIRRVNASLDSLLSAVGGEGNTGGEATVAATSDAAPGIEPCNKVKAAQFEALFRSAERLGIPFSGEYSEESGCISLKCSDACSLGEITLSVRLKAAELKLHTEVIEFQNNNGCASAAIKIRK